MAKRRSRARFVNGWSLRQLSRQLETAGGSVEKEHSMRGQLFSVAMLCLSGVSAPALAASPYGAIYSFGDSLSDVGNVYDAVGLPYAPYSNGRFSNGPNWLDDLSAKLGLGAVTASSSGGHDFAWGGAVTGYPGTDNPVFPFPIPTLKDQVSQFITFAGSAPSSALYTFSIGANDLFGMLSDPNLDPADIPTDIARRGCRGRRGGSESRQGRCDKPASLRCAKSRPGSGSHRRRRSWPAVAGDAAFRGIQHGGAHGHFAGRSEPHRL